MKLMPEAQAALGFTRTPSEDDPRRDPELLAALRRIAPGTELCVQSGGCGHRGAQAYVTGYLTSDK